MDDWFAPPPYHSIRASCFLLHFKPLALSKCHSVLTPHMASATNETRTAMGALQIENLHLYFAGKPVKTPVV